MEKPQQASTTVRAFLASIGRKGGRARIAALTPQQRTRLARKAARARWKRKGRTHKEEKGS